MSVFVIVCAVMALVAIFIVAWPLLRPLGTAGQGEPPAPKAAPLAFALSVALVLASIALYAKINTFPWQDPRMAEAVPAGHGAMGDPQSMEQVTAALEARLAKEPNDIQGWRMLGRTYLVSGNAAGAAQAYERALALSPQNDTELELDLAEALVLTGGQAGQARARGIIDAALTGNPTSQKALWYRGVMAARDGDSETAKASWNALIAQDLPPEIREVVAGQLRDLGVDVPPAAGTPAAMGGGQDAVAPRGRMVRVAIKIDPALASRLQPGVPLFVSESEPGIPGPPIAAVRLRSDQLPTTVVLSDANSMIEGRDLSSVGDVEIVARVAFSGTPALASGDLLGSIVQRRDGPEGVEVLISKVQP
ncbi:MAG: tetratricopeptide repeat protein [Steroidobacteraceae bacterium]